MFILPAVVTGGGDSLKRRSSRAGIGAGAICRILHQDSESLEDVLSSPSQAAAVPIAAENLTFAERRLVQKRVDISGSTREGILQDYIAISPFLAGASCQQYKKRLPCASRVSLTAVENQSRFSHPHPNDDKVFALFCCTALRWKSEESALARQADGLPKLPLHLSGSSYPEFVTPKP